MMTANRFFVPNTEEFFEGLVVLLPQCGLCCQENSSKQNSLEDVLKDINTLWVIHGRVAFQETQLTQDMERLIQVIGTQLESLANLYSDHDQEIDEEMTNKGGRENSDLFALARSGNGGRPRNEVGISFGRHC